MSNIERAGALANQGISDYHETIWNSMDGMSGRIGSTNNLSISPELLQRLHLSKPCKNTELKTIVGNPTPLGVMGFVLSVTPLACDLMEWRGSGGFGAATVGTFYFFGGLLIILAAILEFILGNTFIFVVFSSFAAYWLSLATTLTPFYNSVAAYESSNPDSILGFVNSYAFFDTFMALLCFIYLICSFRTNICFVIIFFTLSVGFCFIAGTAWQLGNKNENFAKSLQKTGGSFLFVSGMAGWYFLLVQMLASVDFPFILPVGDLSHRIKGASDRAMKAA